MALSKLDSLYMAVISDHSKHPHHFGELTGDVQTVDMHNPTCGDVIHLSLRFEAGKVTDAAFNGSGCSISTASASMMCDLVIDKTKEEVASLAKDFSQMVQGQPSQDYSRLGEAQYLAGVAKFPQRIKCATLAWHAIENGLDQ